MFYTERGRPVPSPADKEGGEDPLDAAMADFRKLDRPEEGSGESLDVLHERMDGVRTQLLKAEKEAGKVFSRFGKLIGTGGSGRRTQEISLMQSEYGQIQKEFVRAQLQEKKRSLESSGTDQEGVVQELTETAAHSVIDEKGKYLQEKADMDGTGWVRKHVIEKYKNLGLKKKLLISGGLMGGAAVAGALGQVWLSAGLLATRRALGTLGTSIGTEAIVERAQEKELAKKGLDEENIFAEFEGELRGAAVEAARKEKDPVAAVETVLRMAMEKKRVNLEGKFRERTKIQNRQGYRKMAIVGLVGATTGSGAAGHALGMLAEKTGLSDALGWAKEKIGWLHGEAVDGTTEMMGAAAQGGEELYDKAGDLLGGDTTAVAPPDVQIDVTSAVPPEVVTPGGTVSPSDAGVPAAGVPSEAGAPPPGPPQAEPLQPDIKPASAVLIVGEEMAPEEGENVVSKYVMKGKDTIWGSVRSMFVRNAESLGFDGKSEELGKWASRMTGNAVRDLARDQGGQIHDLIHDGDSVSLVQGGEGAEIVFENTSDVPPGIISKDVPSIDAGVKVAAADVPAAPETPDTVTPAGDGEPQAGAKSDVRLLGPEEVYPEETSTTEGLASDTPEPAAPDAPAEAPGSPAEEATVEASDEAAPEADEGAPGDETPGAETATAAAGTLDSPAAEPPPSGQTGAYTGDDGKVHARAFDTKGKIIDIPISDDPLAGIESETPEELEAMFGKEIAEGTTQAGTGEGGEPVAVAAATTGELRVAPLPETAAPAAGSFDDLTKALGDEGATVAGDAEGVITSAEAEETLKAVEEGLEESPAAPPEPAPEPIPPAEVAADTGGDTSPAEQPIAAGPAIVEKDLGDAATDTKAPEGSELREAAERAKRLKDVDVAQIAGTKSDDPLAGIEGVDESP